MRVVSSLVLVLVAATLAVAQTPSFPCSALSDQDKIDWLTAETDATEHVIDAEPDERRALDREAVSPAARVRVAELARLTGAIPRRPPRLERRVSETFAKAIGGLERIANRGLAIGMTAEQVRQLRG